MNEWISSFIISLCLVFPTNIYLIGTVSGVWDKKISLKDRTYSQEVRGLMKQININEFHSVSELFLKREIQELSFPLL